MGHSRAEKDASHDHIVRVAAKRFRESGVDGVGLADLMREAGLTHGGFYRHFASREDLVGAAIERALRDGGQAVAAVINVRRGKLGKLIDAYLSATHRDDLATSCAVTTLAADVARADTRARAAYTRQVETYLALLSELLAGRTARARRHRAIAALATLVGAVSLARAVNVPRLSQEILDAAATQLKQQLASG